MNSRLLLALLMLSPPPLTAASFELGKTQPPAPAKKPKDVTVHEDKRSDDYFWLRERDNPEVINYLERENAYTEAVLAPAKELRATLYREMVGRIKEDDSSAAIPYRGYEYYTRTEKDKQYNIHCRRALTPGAPEEILFDLNKLAEAKSYIAVGHFRVSPDGKRLAYSVDWTGYRQYEVFVMDLATRQPVAQQIGKVADLEWGAGHDDLYYVTENESKRSDQLHRWTLSTGRHDLIRTEVDELYNIELTRSNDGRWLFSTAESKLGAEVFAAPADGSAPWRSLTGRDENVKYFAEHRDGRFYFVTNREAKNYKIVSAPASDPRTQTDFIPHNPAVKIEELHLFAGHAVIEERENGLPQLRVHDFATGRSRRLEMPEAAYEVSITYDTGNWDYQAPVVRFSYQSLVRPDSVYQADLSTGERTLVKQTEILGGFNPANYVSERLWAEARDGVRIPLSVVYRRDLDRTKTQPLWLYGYGSYGVSLPITFNPARLSLLDRGLVYVIAHLRGGGELGEEWREAGRMEKKQTTFNDFVDCAEWLVRNRWTSPPQLVISGGSAGGLLMGAVLNARPDLFQAALVQVPFVDVLNTMLDATLPLTTEEYIEWGNPNKRDEYSWMRAYSPYDNLKPAAYPHVMVTVSYQDSQVPYWEGAKYLAKLRDQNTAKDRALLLRTTMGAGHGGAAGRYDSFYDVSRNYSFFLSALGLAPAK